VTLSKQAIEAAHRIRIMWNAPDHSTQEKMIAEQVQAAIDEARKYDKQEIERIRTIAHWPPAGPGRRVIY